MSRPDPRDFYRPTMLQRATPGVVRYIEAMEDHCRELESTLLELADLMDDTREGNYKPDSFTTQPARTILAKG